MNNDFVIPAAQIPKDPPGYLDELRKLSNEFKVNLIRRHDHFYNTPGVTLRWEENGNILLRKVAALPEDAVPAAIGSLVVYEGQIPRAVHFYINTPFNFLILANFSAFS